MNIKFNKFSIIMLIILMIAAISIGCQPDEDDNVDEGEDGGINENEDADENLGEDGAINGDTNGDDDIIDDAENGLDDTDTDISNRVLDIEGVNDATVVVRDNTAIVGIDAADTTDGEVSEELRGDIEDRVREVNPDIDEVYISSETDLFDRINEVSRGIRAGDPIDDFTDELDDLIDRLTPDTQD